MGFQRTLAVFLVFSLLIYQQAGLASGTGRETIAVVELSHPESSSVLTGRAADRIRDGLEQDGRFRVLSKRQTVSGLASLGQKAGSGGQNLVAAVRQAQEQYIQLELEAAESSLRHALDSAARGTGDLTLEEAGALVPARILLGVVLKAKGDTSRALQSFEEAVRLAPETVLTAKEYAPGVLTLFNESREKVLGRRDQFGTIDVKSSPAKAKVFLNGQPKGSTPLSLKGVPAGPHYLVLVKEGFADQSRRVDVTSRAPASVSVDLSTGGSAATEGPSVEVSGPNDTNGILREASLAGQWLNADRLILVHCEEVNGAGKITAGVMEMSQPDAFTQKSVDLTDAGDKGRDLVSAVGALVTFVTGTGPVRVADEERPGRSPRSRHHADTGSGDSANSERPIWRRPLFWVIGGLVLAGAGAGIGMAMSGGGGGNNSSVGIEVPPAPGLGVR